MKNNLSLPGNTKDFASEQLLSGAKLARPKGRDDLVPRQRLVNLLELGVQGPLTLVAAPAGFGKTTLLSTWLEHASFHAAWVSLEHDDDDLTRFWSYVFTALARVCPAGGTSALALLQASVLSPRPSIETILTVWLNDLAALSCEVALVLDDYHLIAAEVIHRSITYLLDHLPRQLHLVIATRADPPLPLARLRAGGYLTEIRAADLRFTPEETAAFLTGALGVSLSADDIATLAARTEGWIAGLQLAALSMHGRTDLPGFVAAFDGSHRYIIDYLVEEVLARQSEPVQTFLLQTAILERLEGSLCEAVMGETGREARGQTILEQLERANLFLTPLDDERLWYRYHQLFAEALRQRLQRRQPALAPELHRRASAWYERHGLARDAVHHALAAGDFEQAVRLMEQVVDSLVRRGEITTLQHWVDVLPHALILSHVELAVWQGWLLFVSGQHDAAERHLQNIERTFAIHPAATEQSEPPAIVGGAYNQTAILGRIAAIRASIAITQKDLPRTIALARLALGYLPTDSTARAFVAWYVGKATWLSGDLDAAMTALVEAARVGWEVDHPYAVFLATHDLAQLQVVQGHLHQADRTYRQALQRAQQRGGHQPALGPAYVGRGNLEREWNHLDAAASLLREGIKLCEQTANLAVLVQATIGLAFINQAQGDTDGASALMQQAVQLAERQQAQFRATNEVEAVQTRLSLMQGDEAAALRWAQQCGLRLDQALNPAREREYLTLVRVLIAQRRVDVALKWLANLLRLAEAQGRTGSVIEILMLQAEALQTSGEMHRALECFSRSLWLAEPEGYVRMFVDEGTPLARLLVQLRTRRPDPGSASGDYREHLLALLGAAHDEDVSHSSVAVPGSGMYPLAEPLSERELEVLRLIAAGCSNREVAERLVIALSTVKWYANTIYSKLQVESRTKAIARGRELHLV